MGIHGCTLSWASCAYFYCTLTLLFGDGLAALYNDRRGQPEMQQAMDNAPVPPAKNEPFPPGQDHWYPALLTQKTSTLLSEALDMLRRIKDVGERDWVEAFIHRLGNLAADLQRSKATKVSKELQPSDTNKQRHRISHAINSPVASKFNKAPTKYQVTSAQVNDVLPVNEGQLNRQVVTKPSLLSKEDDDLVFELHSQDSGSKIKSKFIRTNGDFTYHTQPIDSTVTQAVAPGPTPISSTNSKLKKITQSAEQKVRETLLSKLLNEIDELKHRKEAEKEVRNLLKQMDNHHIADFTKPQVSQDEQHSFFEDEFEIEEDEGAAAGELSEDEEPLKNTVSPSWQQVMEAASEAQYPVPEQHQPREEVMKAASEARYPVPEQPREELPAPIPTMSEEMERQLRDGKIVVLSDKIVRTNFQHNDEIDSFTQSISASQSPIGSTTKRGVFNKLPESHFAREK